MVLTALLSLSCLLPSLAAAATPEPTNAQTAVLSGTFGKVVGTDPSSPATAAPDDRPLATWMRAEPLELVLDPPIDDGTTVTITATAASGGASVPLALVDERWLNGPDSPGLQTVVATVSRGHAAPVAYAWLLDVGDRPGSWETMLEMPPLEGRLVTASGAVSGERGHGCQTGFCQEVGYRPPVDTLQPLTVSVGEPITFELSDGSAIVHWQGRAEPYAAPGSETRTAEADLEEPVAGPVLSGLEPDAPGEWLLELRVDYDRERGWQWFLFRLIAE